MAGNDDDEFIFVSADMSDPQAVPTADGDPLISFNDDPRVPSVKKDDNLVEFGEFTGADVDETLIDPEVRSTQYASGRWYNDDDCILEAGLHQDDARDECALDSCSQTTIKNTKTGIKNKFSIFSKKFKKTDNSNAKSVAITPVTTDINGVNECTSGSPDPDDSDDDECVLKNGPKVVFQDESGKGFTDQGLILDFEFVGASFSDQSSS
ncbi:uncharacterized protein LOC128216979 isoform X2 [Mya arenaria]|nr:uncharacterized protein LOC128216979 isoform X2 [Mya arenaria]